MEKLRAKKRGRKRERERVRERGRPGITFLCDQNTKKSYILHSGQEQERHVSIYPSVFQSIYLSIQRHSNYPRRLNCFDSPNFNV